jgi:D-glycero-alpha-D-manno-heptose-7-phosphate kinase
VIITRTPFRVSFVGGGTDLPDFYQVEPGAVVSTAINKYMYIVVNKRFDDTIRISYSKTEIAKDVEQIQHPIVREALKLTGITRGIEVVSIADVPAGAGLGSSSSFTVGLLNALYAYKEVLKSAEELAREACHIEIDIVGEPIGKQDQYIAAYGGLRYIQFNPDETVFTEPVIYASQNRDELSQNLLLFYSGETRAAGSILMKQKANMRQGDKLELLREMRDMAAELKTHLNNHSSPDILGRFLHRGWLLKKQLSDGISNDRIDEYYAKAIKAGALGGKVLGAGGGGFLLLYCLKENQVMVQQALSDLPLTRLLLEPEGSKIIYVI